MAFLANRTKEELNDTVLTRMAALCLTDEHADAYFSFYEEGVCFIPAHKLILAIRSPVFNAMFYGMFPQNKEDIHITDIKSDIFQKLIRYLYTDELDLNGTVVLSLLYAAHKYQLSALLSKCEVFLSEHIDVKNACIIYSQAKFLSMANLQKGALEFIALNAMEIFNSEDFLSLSAANLLDTLQLDSLCISEVNIFRSVLKWAESKLSQSKKLITGQSRRRIMLQSNILYMIGIPLLTLEEYTTVVVPSDVLTDEEQLSVFKAITMKNNSVSKIITGFRMCSRKGSNIINLSVDAILSLCVDMPYQGGVVLASPFRSGGDVFGNYRNGKENEIMYIKASAAVRIVSVIIKPGAMHQNCIQNSTIACVVDGKRFVGAHRRGQSLILEINHDVLPNVTLQLHFEVNEGPSFLQFQNSICMPSNDYYPQILQKRGEQQFRNITKLEHVNISLDVEGVRLVDSLNIMVLY